MQRVGRRIGSRSYQRGHVNADLVALEASVVPGEHSLVDTASSGNSATRGEVIRSVERVAAD
jgi:hypothetical protein